jgi:membrane fusion protein (multidrug efflux system)
MSGDVSAVLPSLLFDRPLKSGPWLVALVAGMAAVGCKKPVPTAFPPTEVAVVQAVARTVPQDYEFVASVAASRRVDVRAQVSGVIVERAFTEGTAVRAGQVLYRIESTAYDAAWRGAKARVAQAEARSANAERNIARLTPLLADNAVAKQDVDNAQAELEQARAAVDDARAEVDQAKKNLDDTVVRAEISGRVGRAQLELGARVTGSGDILTTIDVLDPVYVTFEPSAQQLLSWKRDPAASGLVAAGGPLKVRVVLPDGSELPRTGRLGFIDPVLNPETGTQQFRAEFSNADHLLVPGQFVRAHLTGLARKDAILIPQRAVLEQMGRQVVYVVAGGDTVRAREVRATGWTGNQWLIESGLAPGDRVVVDGVQKTGPGRVVRPVVLADSVRAGTALSAGGGAR